MLEADYMAGNSILKKAGNKWRSHAILQEKVFHHLTSDPKMSEFTVKYIINKI